MERKDEAVVLSARPWRETSLIISFFGREGGRFSCVAKGARRHKGGLGNAAEPLSVVRVVYSAKEGRGLQTLTAATLVAPNQSLREDAVRFACGSWLCELVMQLVPEDVPAPEIFALLRGGLEALSRTRSPLVVVRWFQIRLLDELGYGGWEGVCAGCGRPLLEAARLSAAGGLYCDGCQASGVAYALGKGALALVGYLARADAEGAARTGAAGAILAELCALDRLFETLVGKPSKAGGVALCLAKARG